ncbi:hypothetical protein [Shewanella violacea]|uniref:Uncharacterized protein n=1 Tax=Shewanella violacea (strain JCM 10179 / CIP 106290 / LMG 19151 / DSS12) TaxID=637905 RepID=D4ZHH6_SHEVD|nr:hypothetical protein [Shewanella violacea]BAJ01125.1 hypothetical protein SVI_1154 [Shewanella violacea DSS12]
MSDLEVKIGVNPADVRYTANFKVAPNDGYVMYEKNTPIIPEIGVNITVINTGREEMEVHYEWAPPFGGWQCASTTIIPPDGKPVYIAHPSNAFYYQRIIAYNKKESTAFGNCEY